MEKIHQQLMRLRLHGMARRLDEMRQAKRNHELTLSDGLELLLQAEEEDRDNRRFFRLRKNASFRYQASLEEISCDAKRGLDQSLLTELSTSGYLTKGESILITGSTGCGKSYLASALGHHACQLGFKVGYYNMQKLMMRTKMFRADGSIFKFMERLSKSDLLILDDFGLTQLDRQQQLDLMEIIEDRHGKKSTIVASQLPVASWFDVIGEETIADAILDRLINTSYRIELKGDSLRKKK